MNQMTINEGGDFALKESTEAPRIHSIDFLRGLTIIFMMIWHTYRYWLVGSYDPRGILHFWFNFLGMIAGPLFLVISGISLHILIKRRRFKKKDNKQIFFEIVKRCIFIFGVATVLSNVLSWTFSLEGSFLKWSLFQGISIALFLGFFIDKLRIELIFTIMVIGFVSTYYYNSGFLSILLLLFTGSFEPFPYLNYFLMGLILGKIFFDNKKLANARIFYILFLIVGISIFFVGFIFDSLFVRSNMSTVFKNFLTFNGLFLILLVLSRYFLDKRSKSPIIIYSLEQWGKISFSIYYIHLGIIYVGIFIFTTFLGDFYTSGFPFPVLLTLLIGLIILIEIFRLIWLKFHYILGIEWLMNIIVKKSLFKEHKKINIHLLKKGKIEAESQRYIS